MCPENEIVRPMTAQSCLLPVPVLTRTLRWVADPECTRLPNFGKIGHCTKLHGWVIVIRQIFKMSAVCHSGLLFLNAGPPTAVLWWSKDAVIIWQWCTSFEFVELLQCKHFVHLNGKSIHRFQMNSLLRILQLYIFLDWKDIDENNNNKIVTRYTRKTQIKNKENTCKTHYSKAIRHRHKVSVFGDAVLERLSLVSVSGLNVSFLQVHFQRQKFTEVSITVIARLSDMPFTQFLFFMSSTR